MKWLIHAYTVTSFSPYEKGHTMHFVETKESEMTEALIREIQRDLETSKQTACCFSILGFQPLAG